MRFVFVDAENIGLKELEPINADISDKVLVFSKSESVKSVCERRLFLYVSSYPSGPNQADFYIIGNLVGIIASLKDDQKSVCDFVLYSRDAALVTAFVFQCKLHKVKCQIALEAKVQTVVGPAKQVKSLDQRILDLLVSPMTAEQIRVRLKAEKSEFTRALNSLIQANKISRSSQSQKNWVRVNGAK